MVARIRMALHHRNTKAMTYQVCLVRYNKRWLDPCFSLQALSVGFGERRAGHDEAGRFLKLAQRKSFTSRPGKDVWERPCSRPIILGSFATTAARGSLRSNETIISAVVCRGGFLYPYDPGTYSSFCWSSTNHPINTGMPLPLSVYRMVTSVGTLSHEARHAMSEHILYQGGLEHPSSCHPLASGAPRLLAANNTH